MSGYLPDGCTQEMVDDAMGANDPCPHPERAVWWKSDDEWECGDCGESAFWNGTRYVYNSEPPEYDS